MATPDSTQNNSDGVETLWTIIKLDEGLEGDQIGSRNYRFCPVGENVPIKPDFQFDSEAPPSQPLAVSQRFHLLFVAHSNGFYVAKTKEVMAAAKKIKDEGSGPSIQEICMVDVPIGKVSILALSNGDSLLAASVENQLHFFSISALLHKEQKPSYSVSLDESDRVKDVRWARKTEKAYLVLSSTGKLHHGSGQGSLKSVMVNVDAVEWSAKGDFIVVARKNILSILSPELVEKFSFSLSPESLIVDSIRWARPDSIVLGCFDTGEDSEAANYLVQVITSQDKGITDDTSKPIVLSFSDMFLDFQSEAIPCANGPNLFLSYLDHQELAFIANRKNLSQHVVLLGWSLEDKKNEASIVEISNDAWCAHIDSQENGDENSVLALSIDKVPQNDEIKFLLGEEEKEVSPCCVLICLTIDGKLALFHFASAVGASASPEVLAHSVGEENASHEVLSEHKLPLVSSSEDREENVEKIGLSFQTNDASRNDVKGGGEVSTGINQPSASFQNNKSQAESIFITQEQKPMLNFQTLTDDEQQKSPAIKLNQDKLTLPSISPDKSGPKSEQSSFRTSQFVRPGIVGGNVSDAKTQESAEAIPHADTKTQESAEAIPHADTKTQESADVIPRADSFSGKVLTDLSNQSMTKNLQTFGGVQYPAKVVPTDPETASSFSWSSGKATLKGSNERSSSSSTGSIQRKSSGNSLHFAGGLFQHPSQIKETTGLSVPINSSGQKAPTVAGNVYGSSQVLSHENFASGRSSKSRFNEENSTSPSRTWLASSEQNLSKKFRNVEDMAKQMDRLLEGIERIGGFKDASIAYQKNSVETLEEGLWNLSERCTMWRGVLDERLKEIQLLLDKTVQVLARKIYIRGVLKQATDTQYWDLWNCQKLSSELELKRQHILEVNQELTTQLLELERHLNAIELNKFGESGGFQENQRAMRSRHGNTRQFQSLLSLHNTTGAQLDAAEKLSECLSKQMAALSIESPARKQNVKKELFETIGLTYEAAPYSSPGKDKYFGSPARNQLSISSFSTAAKEESKKYQVAPMKSSEPETVRRRRESLDQNLSRYEPPKTTVKRILLQEGGEKTCTSKSLFKMDEQYLKVPQGESTVLRSSLSDKSAKPTYQSKSQVIPSTQAKQSIDRPSTSLFRWADSTENFPASLQESTSTTAAALKQSVSATTAALSSSKDAHPLSDNKSKSSLSLNRTSDSSNLGDSRSLWQSEIRLHDSLSISSRNSLETVQSNKNFVEIPDFSGKEFGPSESTIRSEKHTGSLSESDSYKTSSSPAGAFDSNSLVSGKISQVKIAAIESHPVRTISSSTSVQSSSVLSSSISLSAFSTNPSAPASSLAILSTKFDLISQANTEANQKVSESKALVSPSFTFPSSLSFSTYTDDVLSSTNATAINERSISPESASQSNVALFASKKNGNPIRESTISNSSWTTVENLRTLASVSQPELPTATSDLKPGDTMPSTPTTELVASLKSENQLNNGHICSPISDLASNDKSEQPSTFQVNSMAAMLNSEMSNDGKTGSLDVVTHEDEMEEEAPESGLATELSLGNLGGFGIGSATDSTTEKPNPFGLGVMNKAATPVSSPPFTPPAPTGEIFRPASFSFQSPFSSQPSQPANVGTFSSGFSTGGINQVPMASGFGQPAQFGVGQKALGSVLGTFGQSRQLGTGPPGSGVASPTGFASGFPGVSSTGFGGGFAAAASSGGGFSSLATSGGVGFAAAATAAGGFATAGAGAGFAGAASAGDGFAAAATTGGGFGSAGFTGSGFGAFSNQQGGGGFSAFGNSSASGRPPSELFTQMRK